MIDMKNSLPSYFSGDAILGTKVENGDVVNGLKAGGDVFQGVKDSHIENFFVVNTNGSSVVSDIEGEPHTDVDSLLPLLNSNTIDAPSLNTISENADAEKEKKITANGFRWIQLSDLHLCSESFDNDCVRKKLIEFIKEKQFDCDYIFITGDIAYKGNYTGVADFIKELLDVISIPNKSNAFWCVGNNDIKRGLKMRSKCIADIRNADDRYAEFYSAINDIESNSLLMETGMKSFIDNYKSVLGRMLSTVEISNACSYYDLGKCNLVVLNTCITSCDDNDEGQLMILENHLQETLNKAKDKSKPFIVIGHHGTEFLYKNNGREQSLFELFKDVGVDLYLCGHSHKLGYVNFNGYDIHQITSGQGKSTDDSNIFSFIFGEYSEDNKTVTVTTYSYSQNNRKFHLDNSFSMGSPIELRRLKKQHTRTSDIYYDAINMYHENNNRVKFIRDMTEISNHHKPVFLTKLQMDNVENPMNFLDAIYKLDHDDGVNPLFIYGDGGSGKTFMLIKGLSDIQESSGRHVLYVPLNNLLFETNRSDEKAIEKYLQTKVFNGVNLINWRQYYASSTGEELLLLLDGFNEIAVTGNRREAIANEIEDFPNWLKCKIVIASRYENVLASKIRFGKKAKITELSDVDVKNYLRIVKPKLSQRLAPVLFDLLKNPLMLNLYGKTTLTQGYRGDGYNRDCELCQWIEFDNLKDIKPTHVLWNYLNREIFKAENLEEKFLAWISVHVFWPRVAFRIQSNDIFDISSIDLDNQIKEGLEWVRKNIHYHYELKRVLELSSSDDFDFDFEGFIEALDHRTIRQYMRVKQAFFAKQTDNDKQKADNGQDSYTFLHQSIRDCLASMHLINVVPTKNGLFPIEWAKKDIFRNKYIFDHFMTLASMHNKDFSDIKKAVDVLRGHYIPEESYVLDNLLFTYRRIEPFNGNLVTFDFSKLDLYNCDLTEMILNESDIEANLSEALRIGDNTFIKPAHNKTVQSIAVSKDGKMVLSCGDDRVLLWKFNERKVDKVIHRYNANLGATNNICCFSADEKKVLFTDENLLMIYSLSDNKIQRHLRTNGKIIFLTSSMENEAEYYFVKDEFGINYCWSEKYGDDSSEAEYTIYPSENTWIQHTHKYGLLLRYQTSSSFIELINTERIVIRRYFFVDMSHPVAVSFAQTANYCAISYKVNDDVNKVVIFDLTDSQQTYVLTDINVYRIAFASSGRYISVIGYKKRTSSMQNYQIKRSLFGYAESTSSQSGFLQTAKFSSLTLYESIICYGTFNGRIVVDEISWDDFRYYVYTYLDNHPPFVTDIAIIAGTGRCIASYEDGVLREWDYKSSQLIRTHERKHDGSVNCVSVAKEKKLFVSGGADGKVLLWDRDESESFLRVIGDVSNNYPFSRDVYPYRIKSVAFAGGDRYIVASTVSGCIFVWDIEDGSSTSCDISLEPVIYLGDYKHSLKIKIYSIGDDERLLAKTIDGDLILGKIDYDGKRITKISTHGNLHRNRIESASFSEKTPFGNCIATCGDDFTIKLWNATTGDFIKDLLKTSDNGEVCFSPDGMRLYYSCRYDGQTHILEYDFSKEDDNIKELHAIHESGSYTIIRTTDNLILTATKDGFIQVCDSSGTPVHKLEVPRTNIDKFKSFHIVAVNLIFVTPSQFLEANEVIIGGKFQEWLKSGKIVNIFSLIRMSKDELNSPQLKTLFGSELSDCANELERIRVLTRAIITCTTERCPQILPTEYDLLESLLIYVYSEGSLVEQNIFTIVELLTGEQNGDLYLTAVFNRVLKYNRNHRALRGFRNFYNDRGNQKEVVDSLLKRLTPLIRIYSETLPSVATEDIHALSVSMVMNFNIGWSCPDSFNQTEKAQILFLEMFWHYMNYLACEARTRKRFSEMLSKSISDLLDIFRSSNALNLNKIETFEKTVTKTDYHKIETTNRQILNYYREI